MRYLFQKEQGFTLAEVLVAATVGILVVAGAYMVYVSQQEGFVEVDNQSNKLQNARVTLDSVTRMLRQGGFGVVTGYPISNAKKFEMTFAGDVDSDIYATLAEAGNIGATQIKVDLDDEENIINITDSIWIKDGYVEQLVPVRSVGGPPVDFTSEPDTIYLGSPLTENFTTAAEIRTVETVAYVHDINTETVQVNGKVIANNITDLEFRYFNEKGTELIPPEAESLSLTDRVNIREVTVDINMGETKVKGAGKRHHMSIEMRNMKRVSMKGDTTPPAPPSGLVITEDETCGHFSISFTPPSTSADNSELADLAGFKVYYGTESDTYMQPAFPVSDEALTEVTVADVRLTNNTTFYVAMAAYDTGFNESALSNEVSFTLEDVEGPPPPLNIEASAIESAITLTWDDPTSDEVIDVRGYRIYRGTTPDFALNTPLIDENELDETITTFEDTDIDTCVTYYYNVVTVDCSNEGAAGESVFGDGNGQLTDYPTIGVTATTAPETPPAPPATVTSASANPGNGQVQLNWINPPDIDFAGVMIRWSESNTPYSPMDGALLDNVAGTPEEAKTYVHDNLVNGQTYYYGLFAYDHCGNYSNVWGLEATPGETGPAIDLVSPTEGMVITTGNLVFEARAYDTDEVNLSDPPDFETDNGKGITHMAFWIDPLPQWMDFPKFEYTPEYCAFGGNTSPCSQGDVSSWCDGTYKFYVEATDNEGSSSTSGYVQVQVVNGGLYTDETYVDNTSGTYKQELNFQITNTSANELTIIGMNPSWDRSYARLKEIQIPAGNSIWQAPDYYPSVSGDSILLDYFNGASVSPEETKTVRLIYTYFYEVLNVNASAGATRLEVNVASPEFSPGDTVYISDGVNEETAVVQSTGSYYIDLTNPILNDYAPWSTKVSPVQNNDVCPMSSSTVEVALRYSMNQYARECVSDEFEISVVEGPTILNAQQDEPTTNTDCSTSPGSIQVENFRVTPVHVEVIDNSTSGIENVVVHPYYDSAMGTVAPSSGYSNVSMSYNASMSRWEGTIPYNSDTRVWYYFTAQDTVGQSTRYPDQGAYTFDYTTDNSAPECPGGLTASKATDNRIDLYWDANSEDDLRGYNVYRQRDCGHISRVYTLIDDLDPDTAGVQYYDPNATLNNKKCYTYYITAEDMDGNESEGCESNTASAGDCPC